jgi:molybdopterin-guanine dinucleotide biosynthesis protein A
MARKTGASAIVLAGGMSRRLGRNKALEEVGGQPLVLRVLDRLSEVTDDAVVVVNDAERAGDLPLPESVRVVIDRYAGSGPLGGIFTGLSACSERWGLVAACDMPFLNTELWGDILARRDGHDAVVPVLDGRPEPTHAAYSKACLPRIEERLKSNDLKIARFFDEVQVAWAPQSRVEALDPDRLSFFNVNTQQDLDRARELAAAGA